MIKITQLSKSVQNILTVEADRIAQETGFVQRNSKLTGALFVQTLVFGFWNKPQITREQLAQTASHLGVTISAQALDKRMHERAAECLRRVLETAIQTQFVASELDIPILSRFNGVYIQDSSIIALPPQLAKKWVGSGNQATASTGSSQVKLSVRLDLCSGAMMGPFLNNGTCSDRKTIIQDAPMPSGALRITDLGYFNLSVFRSIEEQQGYWLSRYAPKTVLMECSGKRIDLLQLLRKKCTNQLNLEIILGAEAKYPCRLIAERLPDAIAEQRRRRIHKDAAHDGKTASDELLALADWSIFVTNVPTDMLSVSEALILAKTRWQIECLWKLWKSEGHIDQWRSEKGPAILCELYAKLIAMLFQHWMIVSASWHFPDRSWTKASASIRQALFSLVMAFHSFTEFRQKLKNILTVLQEGCRINKSKKVLHTYQLLLSCREKP